MLERFEEKIQKINNYINSGDMSSAKRLSNELHYELILHEQNNDPRYYVIIFNLGGLLIDIGMLAIDAEASNKGLSLILSYEAEIKQVVPSHAIYYTLANGYTQVERKSNDIVGFEDLKKERHLHYQWKALHECKSSTNPVPDEYRINLANSLKIHGRFVEALTIYNEVLKKNETLYECWINKAKTLEKIARFTEVFSDSLLIEIINCYKKSLESPNFPAHQTDFIQNEIKTLEQNFKEFNLKEERELTQKEYDQHSEYRKYYLNTSLHLSLHGLHCKCVGSRRDELSIVLKSIVSGDHTIPKMEMILNRLKSEFAYARHLLFEYEKFEPLDDLDKEACFTELFNNEVIGLKIEKVKMGFKLCFGILDRIANAVCELHDLYPQKNQKVYFTSFWGLDFDKECKERLEKFNQIKTLHLTALYSLAIDLSQSEEIRLYRGQRNDLEHNFVVVYNGIQVEDIYNSFDIQKNILLIKESDLVDSYIHLLQLTRSAIYSFVFHVQEYLVKIQKSSDEKLAMPIVLPKKVEF